MEFHEIANMFPLMEGTEFDALVTDIKENGLLEPIWLYENKILDGRNRYRACQEVD
ncbi:MAG: ParB N-terminal domain-containing protein, partial [Deltaproteobacteria bacterium]|nr:ParB N-terminal domain-containing protein [Deltaproteobacteria bacterium]